VTPRHVFGERRCSSLAFGDEEIISKNKETINNPAIAAPIIIGDPILSCLYSCTRDSTENCISVPYRQVPCVSLLK